VEKIPVAPLRKLTSLKGPFSRFSGDISGDAELLSAVGEYLEIRLTDRGITENARDILRKRFPFLLSLRQDEALTSLSAAIAARVQGREDERSGRRSVSGDFRDFLVSLYGAEKPDQQFEFTAELSEEMELFNALLAEVEETSS
jgi:exonuclease SbcD